VTDPDSPTTKTSHMTLFDKSVFLAQLNDENLISSCKDAIAAATERLDQQFLADVTARELLTQRAGFVDELLGTLWNLEDWQQNELALVAVGGYGRGELHPKSDVDLLILLGENCTQCDVQVERFLTLLWDIGLDIGHSVRSVKECVENARKDITILTNLMEARVVRGSDALMASVRQQTAPDKMWPSAEFFRAKLEEQNARHSKYADTEYNLEPNVKSSPGGLRDIQVIGWIAERHFGVVSLEHLTTEEFLNQEESEIITRGQDFMWRVRYALHMITGREEDRLLFDHQRELAGLWGFEDGDRLAVEQFMQLYYRWAGALGQLNDVLIQNFDQAILHADIEEKIEVLNERFQIRNGYIESRMEDLFEITPPALLEVFLLCATHEHITAISAPTARQIRDNRQQIDENFRADSNNQKVFVDILKSPFKLTRQLRSMTRYGVLGNYLPEFGKIVGQMQHDLFHTYTVDAHTLELIENLRRFQIPEFEEDFPMSSRVTKRLPKIELLYMAGLYHDIGKGRGGDHSELGAVDATAFCLRHGLSKEDTDMVAWLVLNHLTMSSFSQKKDIFDPEVIQQFAKHVGDQLHLDYLLPLTVADINATNPTLWNAWRSSLLRQLYAETTRALRRGLENPADKQEWIDKSRSDASDLLEDRGFTASELSEVWRDLEEEYFLRERTEDIAWHTEAIAGHYDKLTPLVLVRSATDSSVANATQIFIHAQSRTHLFSTICAELELLDLSVHDARIYNADGGMSLDTFFVLDSTGQSIAEDTTRIKNIAEHLTEALTNVSQEPDVPQRRTPRQVKSFSIPTETKMTLDEANNVSILEVSTPDRPGLLARVAKIFVDFDIELQAAKIQTLGERVEDVFFLTDSAQQAITDADICESIQLAIRTELDEQAAV
jgi:[protein-PII] uridylyltransferase